ncbi:Alpha/Beta hydrolase protein [Butyriboletus roseoflavus]|nr:Alpha/Beta hydrolase protein [Butyriboletus roseoflavus]
MIQDVSGLSALDSKQPLTISYANIADVDIKLDVYIPLGVHGPIPAVLFFHGGGCFSGTRRNEGISYYPWIERNALGRGYLFIAADYRLLHPFTGLDQLEDALRLFHFLDHEFNEILEQAGATMTLDVDKIAVIGESGGGYIARQAALHAVPRPAALVSYYGMGGDMLSDFWLSAREPQTIPRERVVSFLETEPTRETGLPIFVQDGFYTDALRRADAFGWISQNGIFLDYITGIHGLSEQLRTLPSDQRASMIPKSVQKAFPELSVDASLLHPPVLFVHSKNDLIVPLSESLKTNRQLEEVGVRTELFFLDGAKHGQVNSDGSAVIGMEEAEEAVFRFIDSVFKPDKV